MSTAVSSNTTICKLLINRIANWSITFFSKYSTLRDRSASFLNFIYIYTYLYFICHNIIITDTYWIDTSILKDILFVIVSWEQIKKKTSQLQSRLFLHQLLLCYTNNNCFFKWENIIRRQLVVASYRRYLIGGWILERHLCITLHEVWSSRYQ